MGVLRNLARGLKSAVLGADFSDMRVLKYFGGGEFVEQANEKFDSIDSFLRAPEVVTWVNICCSRIGIDFAMTKGGVYTPDNKPVTDKNILRMTRKPNPIQTWIGFRELMAWHLLLAGNAWILKVPTNNYEQMKKIPGQLWLLNPGVMEPVIEEGQLVRYRMETGKFRKDYELDEIVHLMLPNPRNPFVGLGKIQANAALYKTENAAQIYNLNFFTQGGYPDVLITSDAALSPDDRQEIKERFNKYQGVKNSHKAMVLSGATTKMEKLNISQRDMDFIEQRKFTREEILGIFGVPPFMAGILEHANFSNSENQDATYWKNTISPFIKRVDEWLTIGIFSLFNPEYAYISDNVIREDDKSYSEIATRLVSGGLITPNEARKEWLDMDEIKDDAMNQVYVPMGWIPIGDAAALPEAQPAAKGVGHKHLPDEEVKATSAQRAILRMSRLARKRIGKKIQADAAGYFGEQQVEVEKIFNDESKSVKAEQPMSEAEARKILKRIEDEVFGRTASGKIKKAIQPGHTAVIVQAIEDLNEVMGTSVDASTGNPSVVAGIDRLARKVTGVNLTTKVKIEEQVLAGVDAGESVQKIAKRIEVVFKEAKGYRAVMIARTETASAYSQGAVLSYREAGIETLDLFGCEVPTDQYPCNTVGVPIEEFESVDGERHPNCTGAWVPSKK